MTDIIYEGILTGFMIAFILSIPRVFRMRNALLKERNENKVIYEALNNWLTYEKRFARDKNTFSAAMKQTEFSFDKEGCDISDFVHTVSTGTEMINESYIKSEKAKTKLLDTLAELGEGKEKKCG